jgi:hypothetical protein
VTIGATISALQAIHETILADFHDTDGLIHAPDGTSGKELPSEVTDAMLPLCVVRPGPYTLQAAARNTIAASRSYRAGVLVLPWTAPIDTDVSATITDIWEMIDAFRDRYVTLVASEEVLSSGDVVTRYRDTRESLAMDGADLVVYRKKPWLGLVFQIDVWEP